MNQRIFIACLLLTGILASTADAKQFTTQHRGRQVVVHSSPLPVILHRLVPPNVGRHVTIRQYQAGR